MSDIRERMQPGTVWKHYFVRGSVMVRRLHIRAIVDGDEVVFRYWSRKKQRWYYEVEWIGIFELWDEWGQLKYMGTEPAGS